MAYMLIVTGPWGEKKGESVMESHSLRAQTLEDARVESLRRLRGDPALWKGSLSVDSWGDTTLRFSLDPDGEVEREIGGRVLLEGGTPAEEAYIVRFCERVALDPLKAEIERCREAEYDRAKKDPEFRKYLDLKKRFG